MWFVHLGGRAGDSGASPRQWWNCVATWDNQISSAKTGYSGAYLYNWPYLTTTGGYVYIPGSDSVEVWRYFNDVTSSIFVP